MELIIFSLETRELCAYWLDREFTSSRIILLATSYLVVPQVMAGVTNVDDLNLATFARQDDLISYSSIMRIKARLNIITSSN